MFSILFLFVAVALLAVALPRMADQGAHAMRKTCARGVRSYQIADGVTVYAGMLAQLESGFLNHWTGTSPGQFVGIVLGGDDRARDGVLLGETADTPPTEARVDESGVVLMHVAVAGTVTQADVGAYVYCADSDVANLTKTVGSNLRPVGRLVRFRSATDCDVELLTPAEDLVNAFAIAQIP